MRRCPEAVEGVREDCCLHDLSKESAYAPGRICCHCGDFFFPEGDGPHGQYEPRISKREQKRRERVAAAGAKAVRP